MKRIQSKCSCCGPPDVAIRTLTRLGSGVDSSEEKEEALVVGGSVVTVAVVVVENEFAH